MSGAGNAVQYGHGSGSEDRHPLDGFFRPRSVAVIGASEKPGSVGRAMLWNLISSPFGGTVYAINPRRHNVLGIKTAPDIAAVPERPDLAIIATPAATVPGVLDECIAAGVRCATIISAGFGETGAAGGALEEQIRERVRGGQVRIIGPNSLGVMNPVIGLNAAFASRIAQKGTVGFISQSGALCAAILDWSFRVNVGFSAFVSFGSMLDVGFADLIYYLGNDPDTRSIVLYVQSIGDARSFLSAVREVALNKPIILLKAGRTEEAAEATKTTAYYSADAVCSDEVFSAAIRRSGVLRVDDIESLFSMAEVLGKQPRPQGPRLSILSNAAGPGILATDALVAGGGLLAQLSDATLQELDGLLPEYWSHGNPVDILADADATRYARASEMLLHDENSDGLLIVLTPQVMTEPTETARQIAAIKSPGRKPILASWMGGDAVAEGADILNDHHIPVFPYPDTAARVFDAMWAYTYNLRGLYETPAPDVGGESVDRNTVLGWVNAARRSGEEVLEGRAAKDILAAYGIPVMDEDRVPAGACRLRMGSYIDPYFGPVLVFGAEGPMGEAFRDRALGLPPLNSTLARRMMEQTRVYNVLRGGHGFAAVDTAAIERALVRFSQLVVEQRWIKEIEIKPFCAGAGILAAANARMILHSADAREEELPQLAIRPYPSEYVGTFTLKNGEEVAVRPIRPEDEAMMVRFHESLSKNTVYFRYLRQLALDERIRHERLAEICFIDYDRAMALVAIQSDGESGEQRVLCVCRMVKLPGAGDADFAIVISDDYQGQGLGSEMMRRLIHAARAEKVRRLTGIILPENRPMLRMCMKLGFQLHKPLGEEVTAEMLL